MDTQKVKGIRLLMVMKSSVGVPHAGGCIQVPDHKKNGEPLRARVGVFLKVGRALRASAHRLFRSAWSLGSQLQMNCEATISQ